MPNRTAIFIDGAYLDYILRDEFSGAQIDYQGLTQQLAQGADILRTHYYHCLPYQGNPPTEEERARYSSRRRFFTALERLPRFSVRLGRLEHRGSRPDGSPIFEQKRVDILLGVDLALLSAKGQLQEAVLLAGDSDFIPAIEAAKSEGVLVTLFHGSNPHSELWQIVDERYRINQEMIQALIRNPDRTR